MGELRKAVQNFGQDIPNPGRGREFFKRKASVFMGGNRTFFVMYWCPKDRNSKPQIEKPG
jgi:hypothetical protein